MQEGDPIRTYEGERGEGEGKKEERRGRGGQGRVRGEERIT